MQVIIEKVKDKPKKYVLLHDQEDGSPAQSAIFEGNDAKESVEKYIKNMQESHPDLKVIHVPDEVKVK